MTAALCMMAKDKGGPVIKLQILMWPATDASFSEHSYEKYGQQRFLTLPLMKWSWDRYIMDPNQRMEKYPDTDITVMAVVTTTLPNVYFFFFICLNFKKFNCDID